MIPVRAPHRSIRPRAVPPSLVVIVSVLVLIPGALATGEAGRILVALAGGPGRAGSFNDLVYRSVTLELEHLGYRALPWPGGEGAYGAGTAAGTGALAACREAGARGGLLVAIITGEDGARIELRLFDPWDSGSEDRGPVASGSVDATLDLTLDQRLADLVVTLAPALEGLPVAPKDVTTVEVGGVAAAAAAAAVSAEPARTAPVATRGGGPRLGLRLSGAPHLGVGNAASHLPISAAITLAATASIRATRDHLAVGVRLATATGVARGELVTTRVWLVSASGEVSLGWSPGTALAMRIAVFGGPELLSVEPNAAARLSKVIPYAGAAFGTTARLGESIGADLEMAVILHVERYGPLLVLSPSLGVRLGR